MIVPFFFRYVICNNKQKVKNTVKIASHSKINLLLHNTDIVQSVGKKKSEIPVERETHFDWSHGRHSLAKDIWSYVGTVLTLFTSMHVLYA